MWTRSGENKYVLSLALSCTKEGILEYSSSTSLENEPLKEKLWFGGPAYHWGGGGLFPYVSALAGI